MTSSVSLWRVALHHQKQALELNDLLEDRQRCKNLFHHASRTVPNRTLEPAHALWQFDSGSYNYKDARSCREGIKKCRKSSGAKAADRQRINATNCSYRIVIGTMTMSKGRACINSSFVRSVSAQMSAAAGPVDSPAQLGVKSVIFC